MSSQEINAKFPPQEESQILPQISRVWMWQGCDRKCQFLE